MTVSFGSTVPTKMSLTQCIRSLYSLYQILVEVRGLDGVSGWIEFATQRSRAASQIRYRVSFDGTQWLDCCHWQSIVASSGSSQSATTRDGSLRSARFLCVHVRARGYGVFWRYHVACQCELALASSPFGNHFVIDRHCGLSRRRTLHVLRYRNVREKRTKRVQRNSSRSTAQEDERKEEVIDEYSTVLCIIYLVDSGTCRVLVYPLDMANEKNDRSVCDPNPRSKGQVDNCTYCKSSRPAHTNP